MITGNRVRNIRVKSSTLTAKVIPTEKNLQHTKTPIVVEKSSTAARTRLEDGTRSKIGATKMRKKIRRIRAKKNTSNNEDYYYGYKSESKPPAPSPRDNNNHYSSLGLKRSATLDEIKKAYKKMALKYHPDKNTDNPTAADNFLRIKDAYETLKDPKARRRYDCENRRGGY
mmetsp:Transcript_14648/g.33029  ORF Transcript_14648/g.33029 Transcript_14648/m.33029 type:complete len:171 (+) Transcript_14648:236-748(+)